MDRIADAGPGLTSGSYNPATNTWRKIARPGVSLGGAVTGWTGRQFLAWGGTCCEDTSRDGMAYNPATNTWRKLPAAPLQPRASASGAWTGKELVVAGGSDFFRKTVFRDAAAYNPSTGTWRKLPQMPRALTGGPALWDGKEILFLSSSSSSSPRAGLQPGTEPLAAAARHAAAAFLVRGRVDRSPRARLGRAYRLLPYLGTPGARGGL